MRYFSIGELCRSNVADLKCIPNHPNTYQKMNMEKLIRNVLDPLRFKFGKPIYVNSGFRCATLNELIGGARNSQHMDGKAADITSGNKKDNKVIFELAQSMGLEFDQLINENQFSWIHISYNEDNNRNQVLSL